MMDRSEDSQAGTARQHDLGAMIPDRRLLWDKLSGTRYSGDRLIGCIFQQYDAGVGSGATLFRGYGSVPIFVKYHPYSTPDEYTGFMLLSQSEEYSRRLIAPLVEPGDSNYWIAPFINSESLHQLACIRGNLNESDSFTRSVFADFLQKDALLWHDTQRSRKADLYNLYWRRICGPERLSTLRRILSRTTKERDFAGMELVVNGKSFGKVQAVFDRFFQRLEKVSPPMGCIVHADDQPKNIIVPTESIGKNPENWYIVDYVTAHDNGDWMVSAAKMFHWWDFYYFVEMALEDSSLIEKVDPRVTVSAKNRWLEISYNNGALEIVRPAVINAMWHELSKFIATTSETLELDPGGWEERFRLALFAVVFGSAYRHSDSLAFALPLMVGKSLEYLDCESLDWWKESSGS